MYSWNKIIMFDNFKLEVIELPEANLRVRHGGYGPPLLLLHGHPRTHTTWHLVAPLLSQHFTVVCPDLRGFGQSSKPIDPYDYEASSKRAKARDCIALMRYLGFDRFNLAGHDRGSYTAFRLAMDHPINIMKLALLDCVPIIEALERCRVQFATKWWHWFFYAQHNKPEQAILADPISWYGGSIEAMGVENYMDFLNAIKDSETVKGMLGDYRAGLQVDYKHDLHDRSIGKKLQCPVHLIWSERDDLPELYDNLIQIWQPWSEHIVTGSSIDSGHHMAEDSPMELAEQLLTFMSK